MNTGGIEMSVDKNMELMQTLDDAWNNRDWETFNNRHTEDTAVYWPGQPDPTRARRAGERRASTRK
jgi:hypothetical protein